MPEMNRDELLKAETIGSEQGWVIPLTHEDEEYFAYLRTVFKRYNIVSSKSLSANNQRWTGKSFLQTIMANAK